MEALEHKSRRRDILVDDEDLFRFYDARLPEDVISARHFDKWWKRRKKQDPELLNFEKEMLMKGMRPHQRSRLPQLLAAGAPQAQADLSVRAGEAADGVTVHIRCRSWNQVEVKGFEWLIPGLRHELLVALIKSMPKPMRKNFVPAPIMPMRCSPVSTRAGAAVGRDGASAAPHDRRDRAP